MEKLEKFNKQELFFLQQGQETVLKKLNALVETVNELVEKVEALEANQ